jgi:TolB-like protein/Flp pilus assembly protein TadD
VSLADRAKPAPKRRWSFAPLAAGIVLLLLAFAGGWYILYGRAPKPAEAAHLSVVVLPFTNLSGDPAQDYFADGVTENLTTELSRIRGSFVIARNTAFTYKGKNVDAKEIGKELGVRYVLEGSVQRDQNSVRVNAQLIDTESGAHLWADRFDEDVADLFKLQDQVVSRLVESFRLPLVNAEAQKGVRSKNPDAIDLTMQGFAVLFGKLPPKEGHSAIKDARTLFERALQINPNDARALAGSADTYYRDYVAGTGDTGTDYEAKVLGQANQAIALDPDSIGAYIVKAEYLGDSGRPSEALAAVEAGLAVDPNFVPLLTPRIVGELGLRRYEEAKVDAQRAMRLSPRDPSIGVWHFLSAAADLNLGHVDAAIDEYHRAIDAGFHQYMAYSDLSAAYAQAGKMDEAKAALAEARRINPKLTIKWLKEHTAAGPAVFDGLRKAGLPEE